MTGTMKVSCVGCTMNPSVTFRVYVLVSSDKYWERDSIKSHLDTSSSRVLKHVH